MAEESRELSGGCQCGKIRFSATPRLDTVHLCHCRMCQRATGGLFAAMVGVPLAHMVWHADPDWFHSSDGVYRGYCAACGTPLAYRNTETDWVSLMLGCFDTPAQLGDLKYEWGVESQLPQAAQATHCERRYVSEEKEPEAAARAARSTRQWQAP